MSKQLPQIGFRGTPEYRANLHREALNRGIKVQTLLEQAVESYLQDDRGNRPVQVDSPADVKLRKLFEQVLKGLSAKDRQTLTAILELIETTGKTKSGNLA